jgi:hypothetical protein
MTNSVIEASDKDPFQTNDAQFYIRLRIAGAKARRDSALPRAIRYPLDQGADVVKADNNDPLADAQFRLRDIPLRLAGSTTIISHRGDLPRCSIFVGEQPDSGGYPNGGAFIVDRKQLKHPQVKP